jgi:Xaa-Pro aminopeptidase
LHYLANDQVCRAGEVLLLDVAASYAHYNCDLTRTFPVNGRFTSRQKAVYQAVRGVLRQCIAGLTPGKKLKDWQTEAEQLVERELIDLKLISSRQVRHQDPEAPAFKKYFMHGCGHPIGLDVHDVGLTVQPIEAGWVMTVEPGIYLPEEGFAVRLENTVVVRAEGPPLDLMAHIPIEWQEIEGLMNARRKNGGAVSIISGRLSSPAAGGSTRLAA